MPFDVYIHLRKTLQKQTVAQKVNICQTSVRSSYCNNRRSKQLEYLELCIPLLPTI